MTEYQFSLAAPGDVAELRNLVDELRAALERSVAGYGKVISRPADVDEGEFSQDILVRSQRGQLEVAVLCAKERGKAEVSVSSATTQVTAYLPIGLALVVGFVADKTPELLPILRGLRVTLGAVVGLVVGFLLVALIGAFGVFKAKVDPALEKNVQSAVREVMRARGSRSPT